jgi:hypothetical protein
MPDRRKGYIQKATLGDPKFTSLLENMNDGKIGEIFY